MALLTATQTADRLGVKLATVYAYASRGVLTRHDGGDRTSRFDSRQVEQLARRGKPRMSSHDTSINLLIETSITTIEPDGPRYRGLPVGKLAVEHSFEEVADLLLTGQLGVGKAWAGERLGTSPEQSMDQQIRILCAQMMSSDGSGTRPTVEHIATEAHRVIATIVDSLGCRQGEPARAAALRIGSRSIRHSIASRLWPALSDRPGTAEDVHLLNTALVLLADHELASSTLAVRVAASTWASPSVAVLAGLSAMQGPLHGAASRLACDLLADALQHGVHAAVARRLERGERLAGFGHSVYPAIDPRATVLFGSLAQSPRAAATLRTVQHLQEVVRSRIGKEANIDLALAAFEVSSDMRPHAAETIFTVARLAGWMAHAAEEYGERPLRFRARARARSAV